MPSVGGSRTFMIGGETISVVDGKAANADGTIAGSDLDMASAVRNSLSMMDLDLAAALTMASANPAAFLGLDHELGRIAHGYRASLAVLDHKLHVAGTWIDGIRSVA
jgi:N-acetylglucosamine-6-phosphate deacetylase